MKYPGIQKIIDVLEKVQANVLPFDMTGSNYCIGGYAQKQPECNLPRIADSLARFCEIPYLDAALICYPSGTQIYDNITIAGAIDHLKEYMVTGKVNWNPYYY